MKNFQNSVTATVGNTLNMTETEQTNWIGFIILLVVILILTFLLCDQLITLKQMKGKILKIFGKLK